MMVLLLVGDDLLARGRVASAFRALDYQVVTASTGVDAVNQAVLAGPALIVVLDGARAWTTIEQLRSRLYTKAIPLVASCALSAAQETIAIGLGVTVLPAGDQHRLLEAVAGLR
jgi:CheY-like chemotaxis protein